jgi:hypothetical protein
MGITVTGGLTLGSLTYTPPTPGSAVFNGNSAYSLTGPAPYNKNNLPATFGFRHNNFTVETWVYCDPANFNYGLGAGGTVIQIGAAEGTNLAQPAFTIEYDGKVSWWSNLSGWTPSGAYRVLKSTQAVRANTWTHIAFARTNSSFTTGTLTVYLNGVACGSAVDIQNYTVGNSYDRFYVGQGKLGSFKGNMASTRIVNGTAVYTTNFTPQKVLINVPNTVMLMNYITSAALFTTSSSYNYTYGSTSGTVTWAATHP